MPRRGAVNALQLAGIVVVNHQRGFFDQYRLAILGAALNWSVPALPNSAGLDIA
jgi:hypothetical protein